MSQVRIRGKLLERYATVIAIFTLFGLSYVLWSWSRISKAPTTSRYPSVVSSPEYPASKADRDKISDRHDSVAAAPEVLALPAADTQGDDGFIPVPDDGAVPAGSSVRLDMTSGKRTYKPPAGIDDVTDHRDYVDMNALRELHKRTGGVPKEQSKWKQQFKGVRKQIEDLLMSLNTTLSAETALKKIEELEDYVISTMSNAGGIFHSDHFFNLADMLRHDKAEVRLATASLMFYCVQNNQLTSQAFLSNDKALAVVAEVLSKEMEVQTIYKLVSVMDSTLLACTEHESFKTFTANVKRHGIFKVMADKVEVLSSTAGPEKIMSALSLIAQKTEDESCVHLLEGALGRAVGVPKTLVTKIIAPVCSLVDAGKHPKLHRQCRIQ